MRFLLLDRILEMHPGRYAVGIKNVALSEDYFADHFPGFPVVPGVLMVEAMAQLAGRLIAFSVAAETGERVLPVLLSIQNARFKKFVRPGDAMSVRVELLALVDGAGRCKGMVQVGDKTVCTAEVMLGYDTGQGAGVIPAAAKARLDAWAEEVNRVLFAGQPMPESGGPAGGDPKVDHA